MGAPVIQTQSFRPGGNYTALAVNATGNVTPSGGGVPRTLFRLWPTAVGSAGSLVIADLLATTFSLAATYAAGQAVVSSGTLYYCILASTGNAVTNTTYFNTTIPTASIVYSAAYNATVMAVGSPITLEAAISNGILIAQIPTAASYTITYS